MALCAGLLVGCEEGSPTAANEPHRNPDLPSANGLARYHLIDGDPAKASSIYDLDDVGDNTCLSAGLRDHTAAVSRLGTDGVAVWRRVVGYSLRTVHRFDTLWSGLPAVCLAVGGFDSDGNGSLDEGKVTHVGLDGEFIDELTVARQDAEVWLNDIALASVGGDVCELLAVGGIEDPSGLTRPVAVRMALSSAGAVSLVEWHVYDTLPGIYFNNVEHDSADSLAATYASGNLLAADGTAISAVVVGLSPSLQLDWRRDLMPEGTSQATIGGPGGALRLVDGNLYVVGGAKVQKGGGDQLWSVGLVAALATDGSLQWLQVVTLTAHAERFQRCVVAGRYLCISGYCASYLIEETKQEFGYGLLTRVDRVTGQVLDNWSFGNRDFSSGFNAVMVRGDRAYCGGWTHLSTRDAGFQSWYVDIEMTPASTAFLAGVAGEPPDAAVPPPRPAEGGKHTQPRM